MEDVTREPLAPIQGNEHNIIYGTLDCPNADNGGEN